MKIGYVQSEPIFGEKQRNFNQIKSQLKGVKADLFVLPELFATGYAFTSKKEAYNLSEPKKGKTSEFLISLAKDTNAIIVGGFIEREKDDIYNSAMFVDKNGIINIYRKIHLFYKENLWFSPGNRPLEVNEVKNMKIGIMICFDWFFPEVTRTLAVLGADIIAHPANLVLPYCQDAMITRCLENRVFTITANRIGREKRGDDDFTFTGRSQITSYEGEILSRGPDDGRLIDFVEIDYRKARNKRINEFNNLLKDRRKKFYL